MAEDNRALTPEEYDEMMDYIFNDDLSELYNQLFISNNFHWSDEKKQEFQKAVENKKEQWNNKRRREKLNQIVEKDEHQQ